MSAREGVGGRPREDAAAADDAAAGPGRPAVRALLVDARLASALAAGLGLAITALSLLPQPELLVDIEIWDKAAHFLAYGSLACALAHAVWTTRAARARRGAGGDRAGEPGSRLHAAATAAAVACVAAGLYGVLMEVLQGLVPGRTTSGLDALANLLGALLGAGLWTLARALAHAALGRGARAPLDPAPAGVTGR